MAQKEKDWFKVRGYLHLDNKISADQRSRVYRYVSNNVLVARHAFLPLLHKVQKQRRLKYDDKTHTKKNNANTLKERPLHYAGHMDSQVYAYYANVVLAEAYKKVLDTNVDLDRSITAYRRIPSEACPDRNKNNIDFAKEVFDEIKRRGECIAMAFDIESFFSNLDHKILKQNWNAILKTDKLPPDHYNIFKSVTDFHFVNLNVFRIKKGGFNEKKMAQYRKEGICALIKSPNEINELVSRKKLIVNKNQRVCKKEKRKIGIPQGLPISSVLANIYMLPFDQLIVEKVVKGMGAFYRRYSDDIVIVCNQGQEKEIERLINETIAGDEVRLSISTKKTEISLFQFHKVGKTERLQAYRINGDKTEINVPFTYLGFEFYGYQTLIKSAKIAGFYRKMKTSIKRKNRMAQKKMEQELTDKKIIFKTRLYRLYSLKGINSRKLKTKNVQFVKDGFGQYRFENKGKRDRKYRGNTLTYARRASEIMDEEKILKQYRRHLKIFHQTLKNLDKSSNPPSPKRRNE